MKKLIVLFLLVFYLPCSIYAMTFNAQGIYDVGVDVSSSGTAILITADNVEVNLHGHCVSGQYGVVILPGLAGVIVHNGNIMQTETGISIQQGTSFFSIYDMNIAYCSGRAIELLGTSSAPLDSGYIRNINISYCATDSLTDSVVTITWANNMIFEHVYASGCGNSLGTLSVAAVHNSTRCTFFDTLWLDTTAANLTIFDLNSIDNGIFKVCSISNNTATNGNATGINLHGNSSDTIFDGCQVLNLQATGTVIGFNVTGSSIATLCAECNVIKAQGLSAFGFVVSGTGSPSSSYNNLLTQCAVVRCIAQGVGGESYGFVVNGADFGALSQCGATYNSAPQGIAAGLTFLTSAGGNNWGVKGCEFVHNLGSTDANSYGILISAGSNNLFVQNFVFDNGADIANQLSGVPAGACSLLTPTTINTPSGPWANLGVVNS